MCTATVQLRHQKIKLQEKNSHHNCTGCTVRCHKIQHQICRCQMWNSHICRFWGRDWRPGSVSTRGQRGGQSGAPGTGEDALGGEVHHREVRRPQRSASGVPELVDTDSEPAPGKQQASAARLRPQTGQGSTVQKGNYFSFLSRYL